MTCRVSAAVLIAGKGWVLAMLAFPKPGMLRVAPVPAKTPPLPSIPRVSDARGMGRAEERAAFQTDQGTGEGCGSPAGRVRVEGRKGLGEGSVMHPKCSQIDFAARGGLSSF